MLREYFEIVKEVSSESLASRHAMKSHFFKLLHAFLNVHKELRPDIGKLSVHASMDDWEKVVIKVEEIVEEIYKKDNIGEIDVITVGELESWGGRYKTVPFWRCQPYFRTVNGEKQNVRTLHVAATEKKAEEQKPKKEKVDSLVKPEGKRKAEDELQSTSTKKAETSNST